jgi:two-component system, cell cycle sensor histidine kinase and response regulator CckA
MQPIDNNAPNPEHQRLLIEYAPVAVAMFDREMRYLALSRKWALDFHLSGRNAIGVCHYDVFPETPERCRELHRRCLTGAAEKCGEELLIPAAGVAEWWQWEVSSWRTDAGETGGVVVFAARIAGRQEAGEALRQSEREIEAYYHDAAAGLCAIDRKLRFLRVNERLAAINGIPAAAHLGRTVREVLPQFADQAEALMQRIVATGGPVHSAEFAGETAAHPGETRHWRESWFPVKDSSGQVAGVNVMVEDITAERQLQERLRRYEWLAENSRDIILHIRRKDGRILEANAAAAHAYGYTRDELLDRSIRDLRDPATSGLTSEQMDEAEAHGILFETVHCRRDGSSFPVEVSACGATIGGVRTLISVIRDITSRRRMEEAARLWQRAFQQTELGIILAGTPGENIIAVNPAYARMHGYTPEEMTGLPVACVYPIERLPQLTAGQREIDTGTGHTVYETEHVRKDGSRFPALVDLTAVRDAEGHPVSRVAYVLDITSRKRAEDRLRQAQRMESVALLAGGIAHDFNNLLTGLMGHASLLLEDVPPESAAMVRAILSSAERAAHLTRQLLAYSGKGQFIIETLDLSQAAHEISSLVRRSIPQNVELRMEFTERPPSIAIDPRQLQQVIANLIVNAGEAIGEGRHGVITVSTRVRAVERPFVDAVGEEVLAGRYVCLEITDDGAGMDDRTRAKIFEPFFTTKFTGRGLGLAAVAGIVRAQMGGVEVESAPGQGSVFRVLFPAAGSRRNRAAATPAGALRGTILVVDDEESVQEFLKTALKRQGYQVYAAFSGKEALALCETELDRIDAIVLDIVMPAMGGTEFLRRIRAQRPDLKILLTSGYSEQEARRLCEGYGGTLFIQKPFSIGQLGEKLAALFGGRS